MANKGLCAVLGALAFAAVPAAVPAQSATPAPDAVPSASALPSPASRDEYDGKWHTLITPYVWLPSISGTVNFHHPALLGIIGSDVAQITVGASASSVLSHLNSGGLIAGEVRKDAFAVGADLIFMNLSDSGNRAVTITGPDGRVEIPLTSAIGTHINNTIWEIIPGYTLAHGQWGNFDAFIGVRSISLHSTLGWTFTGPIDIVPLTGSANADVTLTDFIGGIRGKLRLGDRFFIPYYGDAGSGGSNSTSQYYSGIGYAQNWGNLILLYRSLEYNQNGGQLLQHATISGLAFGATFKL